MVWYKKATLLKSYFSIEVLLLVCCIFSEHLFLKTPLDGCFQNLLEGNAFFLLFIVILNISVKWNSLLTKIIRNHVKQCSYHKWYWKLQSKSFNRYIQFNFILHVIRMSLLCHLYIRVCHSYIIRMSLVFTRISSVCHSYVFVCHSYVTPIYLYIIRMSHVCTRMSFVCHSYILVCHLYVTGMYSYVIRMSLVCGFTLNPCKTCFFDNWL